MNPKCKNPIYSLPKLWIVIFLSSFTPVILSAQSNLDTLIVSNGDKLIGEIKSMEKAIIQLETDYSDSDFKIDWDNVKYIHSNSFFLINLTNGTRVNGRINTSPADSNVLVITSDMGEEIQTTVSDVVFIRPVKSDFISRLSASIGIGGSFTKSNNLRQFNVRSSLGYTANTWSIDGNYNQVYNRQDSVEDVRRTDAGIGAQWFLPRDWFVSGSSTFLSNTEQKLDLRATPTIGIGNYLVRSNALYLSVLGGLAWNIERFETEDGDRNSLEGVIGAEANLFDTGDLSLLLRAFAYPSITESGRFRSDVNIDLKYDFPYDIYVKLGTSLNYDNRPAAGASKTDYVFQWTIGWEL